MVLLQAACDGSKSMIMFSCFLLRKKRAPQTPAPPLPRQPEDTGHVRGLVGALSSFSAIWTVDKATPAPTWRALSRAQHHCQALVLCSVLSLGAASVVAFLFQEPLGIALQLRHGLLHSSLLARAFCLTPLSRLPPVQSQMLKFEQIQLTDPLKNKLGWIRST